MNDWWNDPPEEPEPPECPDCGEGFGDIVTLENGEFFKCDACGHVWPVPNEPDYEPEDLFILCFDDVPQPHPEHCPHGNEWGECSACDHEGDLAYDAARERRFFSR